MLKKITLKGAMGKKFGRHHEYAVADLREALRAMCATIPGFKKYMSTAHIDGVRFAFLAGGKILASKNSTLPRAPMNS